MIRADLDRPAGRIHAGGTLRASFTAETVITTDLPSVFAPPDPVLACRRHRFLTNQCRSNSHCPGSQLVPRPHSHWPPEVNFIAESLVPSPTVNVRPVVWASDRQPWATDIVILIAPVAASTSATLVPVINVSSLKDLALGNVSADPSLIAATVGATDTVTFTAPMTAPYPSR